MDKAKHLAGLHSEIKFLKGVGELRARKLAKLGVVTVLDLMEYFPKAYISRKLSPALSEIVPGDLLAFTAMISWVDVRTSNKGKNILNLGVSDGKLGLVCSWFAYPKAYETLFKPGRLLWLSGSIGEYNGQLQMLHPDFELLEEEDDTDGDNPTGLCPYGRHNAKAAAPLGLQCLCPACDGARRKLECSASCQTWLSRAQSGLAKAAFRAE